MPRLQSDALADRATRDSPELATLQEGQKLGGLTARALCTGAVDQPIGARFFRESGMTVDALYFASASVPQVFITVRALPVSDKGESHRSLLPTRLLALSGSFLDG